jgi:hypothetical protein
VAEITAVVAVLTDVTEIENVPETAPAGTVIEAGTEAKAGTELDKDMLAPPAGAGALRITVFATVVPPPTMFVGDRVTVSACAAGAGISTFWER